MKDRKRNGANTAKQKYLLSGLIECGKCGGTLMREAAIIIGSEERENAD